MSAPLRAPFMLALALTLGTAQAADLPPPPNVVQKQAISAQGVDLNVTLAVDKIKVSILQGDDIGGNALGWFCSNRQALSANENLLKSAGPYLTSVATQELKRLGYPLAGKGKATAFDVDVNAAPDFRIGGILTEIKQEVCSEAFKSEGWVHYKIDWALFSEKQQKVVYQASTDGLAVSKEKIPDLHKRAIVSSLANFLSASAVLDALKANPAAAAPVAPGASAPAASAPAVAADAGTPANTLALKGAAPEMRDTAMSPATPAAAMAATMAVGVARTKAQGQETISTESATWSAVRGSWPTKVQSAARCSRRRAPLRPRSPSRPDSTTARGARNSGAARRARASRPST